MIEMIIIGMCGMSQGNSLHHAHRLNGRMVLVIKPVIEERIDDVQVIKDFQSRLGLSGITRRNVKYAAPANSEWPDTPSKNPTCSKHFGVALNVNQSPINSNPLNMWRIGFKTDRRYG